MAEGLSLPTKQVTCNRLDPPRANPFLEGHFGGAKTACWLFDERNFRSGCGSTTLAGMRTTLRRSHRHRVSTDEDILFRQRLPEVMGLK